MGSLSNATDGRGDLTSERAHPAVNDRQRPDALIDRWLDPIRETWWIWVGIILASLISEAWGRLRLPAVESGIMVLFFLAIGVGAAFGAHRWMVGRPIR